MSISPSGGADRPPDSDQTASTAQLPEHMVKTSTEDAPTVQSWRYAEDFHPESETVSAARRASQSFGVIPVLRGAASALTLLARAINARAVMEIGSGAGVSGLALFAGMQSDGVLTSVDMEAEHQQAARQALESAGIAPQRFRLIAGDALSVLPRLSSDAYDLVLIDADKLEYPSYVDQALRMLHSGGLLAIDNALWHNRIADDRNTDDETEAVRSTLQTVRENESLISALLPVGDGLLVAVKN